MEKIARMTPDQARTVFEELGFREGPLRDEERPRRPDP
jgi:hypothetical protein